MEPNARGQPANLTQPGPSSAPAHPVYQAVKVQNSHRPMLSADVLRSVADIGVRERCAAQCAVPDLADRHVSPKTAALYRDHAAAACDAEALADVIRRPDRGGVPRRALLPRRPDTPQRELRHQRKESTSTRPATRQASQGRRR